MKRTFTIHLTLFVILCSNACSTTTPANDSSPQEQVESEAVESNAPIVAVVPDEACPPVEPDLTTVTGAEFDPRGLQISVRTTTWCDNHEFTVHRCDVTEETTTFRVSETNDCEMPNDGVVEHVLLIEREHLGESASVESFDAGTVTVTK